MEPLKINHFYSSVRVTGGIVRSKIPKHITLCYSYIFVDWLSAVVSLLKSIFGCSDEFSSRVLSG